MITWEQRFERAWPRAGASEAEIELLASACPRALPESYLSFLRFSNGGTFRNADRLFDPFFNTAEVLEYTAAYDLAQRMPGALPIAFDGGGGFFLLDLRFPSPSGEYPVLFCGSGSLSFDDVALVAPTFESACAGTSDPWRLLSGA